MRAFTFNLRRFAVFTNSTSNSLVSGTNGNDSIRNYYAAGASIKTGNGNDTVVNYAQSDSVLIDTGADDDYISNGSGDYRGGSNVTMLAGAGNDKVYNSQGHNSKISLGAGDDSLYNSYGQSVIADAGKGNDTIINYYGRYSSINAGAGNNFISLYGGENIDILGGSGKDTVYNGSDNVTLDTGAGNDSIYNRYGDNIIINAGAGNDIIQNYNGTNILFKYADGDGNDRIEGMSMTDTLEIGGGTGTYSSTASGEDVIVSVGNGKITLVGAAGKSVYIEGKKSSPTVSSVLNVTNTTESPVKIGSAIKTVNAAKRTTPIKITGNSLANSISGGSKADTIYGGAGADTILGNAGNDNLFGEAGNDLLLGGNGKDTLNGGKGNNTLTGGKGADIFVYNGGKDVITDYAEEDKISIASGDVDTVKTVGNNVIFTVGKNKITVTGGKGKTVTYIDKAGTHTYPDASSAVSVSGSTVKLLKGYIKTGFNIANYGDTLQTIDASEVVRDVNLKGNDLMNKIIGGNGNDTLIGGKSNDTLTGGDGADVFVWSKGDGTDVITDYTAEDLISIASGEVSNISSSGNDVIFKLTGNGKIIVKDAKDKVITHADSEGNQKTYPTTVNINGTKATLAKTYMKDTFNADDYGTSIQTIDASKVTHDLVVAGNKLANKITGSSQDDSISGGNGADTLSGGKGNDTLIGGKGNDSLKGGAGADVFVYASGDGDDVITDYTEEDLIRITKGTPEITTSGKNVVFKVGSGKMTIKNSKDKVITYLDNAGNKARYSNTVVIEGKTATLSDKYSGNEFVAGEYGSAIRTVDASMVDKNLKITGSGYNDKIFGGAGNDTLIGGRGDDTLQGGNGKDIFVYESGDGNDVILNYEVADKIKIASGTLSDAVEYDGKDVIFSVNNSGTITVKNGKGKKITFIDKDNDPISNKRYMQVESTWFTADDNNFDTDNQLGSIVKDSAAAYSFDTSTDLTSLTPKDALITYTDK